MASDEELAGRIASGDEAALEELLGRYSLPLASVIARHTGGHDVEDLHQETWIRVLGGIDSFDRSRKFSTWLFRIATNLCRDWHRRRSVRASAAIESAKTEHVSATSSASLDAQTLLSRLSVEQREAVVLRYYHDLSEAEMAEVMGVARGTVKSRLHAALAKLSRFAAEMGEDV